LYPSEAAFVILSATSDYLIDALCARGVTGRHAFVSTIRGKDIRIAARSASLAWNARELGDHPA